MTPLAKSTAKKPSQRRTQRIAKAIDQLLLLSPDEVAEALGVSKPEVKFLILLGELPLVHVLTNPKVPAGSVREFIKRGGLQWTTR